METERVITERRDKKAAKGKGLRGSSKSGGQFRIVLYFLTDCMLLLVRVIKLLETMRGVRGVGCSRGAECGGGGHLSI